ncbi:hypothetical protein A4X06_0g6649 [Tilletia controversa]|uniref:Integrase catalytic domain-containing protein n=1 Tax=Tilletia controversa TaxID=13291 RepID=A0A8X7MNS7_9BASI|nr:hypothetical protein CF328_g6635 [Tilletia controversa]KAE8242961.1 hypothetical protein A4X06_0g6649 [Tilletia controversa]
MRTKGFTTVTFFIEGRDSRDKQVFLECTHDLHVMPDFGPGLLLGRDFIDGHDLTISPARGRARVGQYTFAVSEKIEGPFSAEVELHTAVDVVVPSHHNVWVPVDAGGLAPDVDYCVHPRLSASPDETVQLAGPTGLLTKGIDARRHVLLGNFGATDCHLKRGTIVADAVATRVGDALQDSGRVFTLSVDASPPPTYQVFVASAEPDPLSGVADPIDAFEPEGGADPDPRHDSATVQIDGHFRVGVDDHGHPSPAVVALLRRHEKAFALDGRPGLVLGAEMAIDLKEGTELRPEAPRRVSPEKRQAIDSAIDQLLQWDVVEPSSSPASFPVLMVRQYGKWRFCVDYRQLNASTIPDRYPLPTVDSVFQTLCGKRIFSSLDAIRGIRGYHQLPVRPSDRWKTAFTCHRGLFQYRTVPFGLRNAPAVFQRLMDRLLGALRWQDAVVYIDDIVVATANLDDHLRALESILSSAEREGLRFSPGKCTFAVGSLVLLGRKVSGAGVAIWSDRAAAVRDLARPTTLRELYHALGLFGYYRMFVPNYAQVAEPLSRLTRGWRYEQADGRYRLVNADGRPAAAERVVLDWTAAQQQSFDALKAALVSPPVLAHPDPARPYLLYVDASKDGFGAILHQVFDRDVPSPPQSAESAQLLAMDLVRAPQPIARERWTAWLRADRLFAPVVREAESRACRESLDGVWSLRDGVLVRRQDGRLALPEGALPELLRVRPLLGQDVKYCSVCQRTKLGKKTGELRIDRDPQTPFEVISLDIVLGLPSSRSGNNTAVVILDVFSRAVLIEPCPHTITAEGIAAIVSNRVLRYGWRRRRLVSDSEARLTGSVMSALATSLGADIAPSPPYHQQANAVERAIKTVQHVLQSIALDSRAHWDRRLAHAVELAMNSSPSVTTGHRPFDLLFISHPDIVHAVFDSEEEHAGVGTFAERLAAAEERLVEARRMIVAAREGQKRRYDQSRASPAAIRVGDLVYVRLRDRPVPNAIEDKLDARKRGPFAVTEVLSAHRIRLDLPDDMAIDPVISTEQVDVVPRSPDPFSASRAQSSPEPVVPHGLDAAAGVDESAGRDEELLSAQETIASEEVLRTVADGALDGDGRGPPRARRLPVSLRGFHLGVLTTADRAQLEKALGEPTHRPRRLALSDRSVLLEEKPVAFLSRLTTPAEQKMVAAELELRCLAWAFAKWAYLVPTGGGVSDRSDGSSADGGDAAIHGWSALHSNVDALSRLRPDPGRSAFLGGNVLDVTPA